MIDEQIGEEIVEYVQHENQPPATLFRTDDPVEIVEQATRVANSLAVVITEQKLATRISGREHVRVEGWTLLGSMLGVFPVVVWTRELGDGEGWEARVEARTRDGAVVGAAEAECRREERTWKGRDSYALRSMAQTRATSKALRHPLGFVMTLAGFEATPIEEMPRDEDGDRGYMKAADPKTGRVTIARGLDDWAARMDAIGVPREDALEWLRQACDAAGVERKWSASGKRANEVLVALTSLDVDLALYEKSPRPVIAVAFAEAFDGAAVDGPAWRIHASETDRPPQFAPPSAEEQAEGEQIPFGEEQVSA